jgi:hypothetical protein
MVFLVCSGTAGNGCIETHIPTRTAHDFCRVELAMTVKALGPHPAEWKLVRAHCEDEDPGPKHAIHLHLDGTWTTEVDSP